MSAKDMQVRTTFNKVAIGQRFYDPISAEVFIKRSADTAAMVTGIGDGTVPDDFEQDDVVRVEAVISAS
jgi:hypothetical protein